MMIIVCDNTDIAELFYKNISGEDVIEVVPEDDDEEDEEDRPRRRRRRPKPKPFTGQARYSLNSSRIERAFALRCE